MQEGCARSGSGMELAKGHCVRTGSRGRGIHEKRVSAVAGHAALNHVETNSWRREGDGGRPSKALPGPSPRAASALGPRAAGGQLCREVLVHAGRLLPLWLWHGAGKRPLCAHRVARAWHSREEGRRGSRARGIALCGHEFPARGRWWEAVEGAPRSDPAQARCREGAGRCRRDAPACIRRRGAKAAAMEGPKSVLPASEFGMATSLRLSEGGIRGTAGAGALAAFGCPNSRRSA